MRNKYKVIKQENGEFFFRRKNDNKSKMSKIYLLDNPEIKSKDLLLYTEKDYFSIKIDRDIDRRPYFLIETDNDSYIIAERTLQVDGMNNFRDLGGYSTISGNTVKWGKLYRSDHLYNATDVGVKYLNNLNINTIIDYRSQDEIEKYPNKKLNNNPVTINLDPKAHAAELSAQFQASKENEDLKLINKIIEQKRNGKLVNHTDIVLEQYETFVNKKESKEAFSKMLKTLADFSTPAVVQHCRGGKDRTGFGVMLILGVLGVSKEDIVSDYLITAKNREKRNHIKMANYKKITTDKTILDYLYSFIDTKPVFIESSLNSIEKNYGTIENYVCSELELTQTEIQIIKELYLD